MPDDNSTEEKNGNDKLELAGGATVVGGLYALGARKGLKELAARGGTLSRTAAALGCGGVGGKAVLGVTIAAGKALD